MTSSKPRGKPFKPGNKLGGRKPLPKELVEACRLNAPLAVGVLQNILERWAEEDRRITPDAAIRAATALLDRGYGKSPEHVVIENAHETDAALGIDLNAMGAEDLKKLADVLRFARAAPVEAPPDDVDTDEVPEAPLRLEASTAPDADPTNDH
jgi:hypothetical protein